MTTTQTVLTADTIVKIMTTVRESARHVDYDDILEAVTIDYDEGYDEAPWDSCDGFEHDYRRADSYGCNESDRDMRGYGISDGRRESFVITISDEDVEKWGNYDYYRDNGCSKQVAFELTAQAKRDTIDKLVGWYSDGWYWYVVHGNYGDDYSGAIGGIDSVDYGEEVRYDVADEIVSEMERDGYIVSGRENPHEWTKQKIHQDKMKRNKRFGIVKAR